MENIHDHIAHLEEWLAQVTQNRDNYRDYGSPESPTRANRLRRANNQVSTLEKAIKNAKRVEELERILQKVKENINHNLFEDSQVDNSKELEEIKKHLGDAYPVLGYLQSLLLSSLSSDTRSADHTREYFHPVGRLVEIAKIEYEKTKDASKDKKQ